MHCPQKIEDTAYADWKFIIKNMTMDRKILPKEVLTLEEAAEYMGLKKSYLYRLTHEKRIRHYKPNNKMIYFKDDLL